MFYDRTVRHNARGFSFIEVMVVVVIIGLLAAAVTMKVSDYIDKAKRNRAKSDIATICNAIEAFYADRGRYPNNDEWPSALSVKINKDPWNNDYQYNSHGRNAPYEVICFGADGRDGGSNADADIISGSLNESE